MMFREQAPTDDLRPYVDCTWMSTQPPGEHRASVIAPDACVEIIVAIEGGFRLAGETLVAPPHPSAVRVLGLATGPLDVVYEDHASLLGVRLSPAGAMRLLGDELHGLVGGVGDGEDVLPALSRDIAAAAAEFAESGSPETLHALLRAEIHGSRRVDPRLERASRLLHSASPGITVAAVAEQVGVSTRQLDRWFDGHLGVSPKVLARIARFRNAFSLGMIARRGDWAAVAAHCGYADQAHLSREFLEFSRQSPERMRASLKPALDV